MAGNQHNWTKEQYQWLLDHSAGRPRREIYDEFRRVFHLELSDASIKGAMRRVGARNGLDARFQKWHIPANKGKKMPPEIYARSKGTMFKLGNVPVNTVPIGTEKVLADGYVWVKVADHPRTKKQRNWKQKQRLIWEQIHGPIPDNVKIIFLDRNSRNFDPENLAAVTNGELVTLNRKGLLSTDPELTKTGINTVRLMSRIKQRELETKKKKTEEKQKEEK